MTKVTQDLLKILRSISNALMINVKIKKICENAKTIYNLYYYVNSCNYIY